MRRLIEEEKAGGGGDLGHRSDADNDGDVPVKALLQKKPAPYWGTRGRGGERGPWLNKKQTKSMTKSAVRIHVVSENLEFLINQYYLFL